MKARVLSLSALTFTGILFLGCGDDTTKNYYGDSTNYKASFKDDVDGDGIKKYPFGPDYDDDGDGLNTYLVGGQDYDDSKKSVGKEGLGNGYFSEMYFYSVGEDDPGSSTVADMNNDGRMDFIVMNSYGAHEIWTSAGNKDINLQRDVYMGRDYANSGWNGSTTIADMNGDGNLDILGWSKGGTEDGEAVRIVWGNGEALSSGWSDIDAFGASDVDVRSLAILDIENDGDFDIAIVDNSSNVVQIATNDGNGVFTHDANLTIPSVSYMGSMQIGDVDSDGDIDLVVTRELDSEEEGVSTFLNDGNGTFGSAISSTVSLEIKTNGEDVLLADMNDDGNLDFVAQNNSDIQESDVTLETGLVIAYGEGDGTFANELLTYSIENSNKRYLSTADLNGDGKLDVLASLKDDSDESIIYYQLDDGNFTAAGYSGYDYQPSASRFADMDGDGVLDIVSKIAYGDDRAGATVIMYGQKD